MALSDTTALAADLQTYFARALLIIAKKDLVFRNWALIEPLPSNSSLTVSFTQYNKLPIVAGTLTQGVPPTSNTLSSAAITATVDQIGAFVELTDLAVLTVNHPVVQEVMQLLGAQAGESIDLRIQNVLIAGTTVQYAGGAANRAALAQANVMATAEFQKAVKTLRVNGALPFDRDYVMVVDPSVEQDILSDTRFTNVAAFNSQPLYDAEVGRWYGIRVVRSNNIATVASTTTVHVSYVFGRNAYAITDLQSLQMFVQSPGGVADPLEQKRTMGWKTSFKAVILNNSFFLRVESGSNFN
jgi:N4-gp56 family major capsid protein